MAIDYARANDIMNVILNARRMGPQMQGLLEQARADLKAMIPPPVDPPPPATPVPPGGPHA